MNSVRNGSTEFENGKALKKTSKMVEEGKNKRV